MRRESGSQGKDGRRVEQEQTLGIEQEYFERGRDFVVMHPRTKYQLEYLLTMLKEQGCIHSTVFLPIRRLGGSRLMRGSWAVRLVREFIDTPIPGRIMPPMYCLFSFTTQMVVAVPISIRMSGTGYRLIPATAPTIRSVPLSSLSLC